MSKPPRKNLTERLDAIGRDGSNRPVSLPRRVEEIGHAVLQDQLPEVDWTLKESEHGSGPDSIGFDRGRDQPYTAEIKLGRTRSANPAAALPTTVLSGRQGSAEYTEKWLRGVPGRRK
jgi:hypothetical protein